MAEPRVVAKRRYIRRERDGIAVVVGLLVLAAGMLAVRNGKVSGAEEAVFDAVNGLPGALYPVLWPFQQLGALMVGPLVAVGALCFRRFRLAAVVLVATLAKLATERSVKAMVTRRRPGTSIGPDVHLRGDVSVSGESFVSGHALLVALLAMVVSPYLTGRWKVVPWVLVALVAFTRVYVGAHNPLDVVCGVGLGLAVGGGLNLIVGVPAETAGPQRERADPEPVGVE